MKSSRPPAVPGGPSYLMYEDISQYEPLQKIYIATILGATLVAGMVLLFYQIAGAVAMFGVTVLDAVIFYFVLPRRYQVFNTKLRIVLGWPLGWDISLSTIREARPAPGMATWIYWGVRLATSSRTAVEIIRNRGWNIIISPSNREAFLARLDQALKAAQDSQ